VQIDEEIRRFIDAAYEGASRLIEGNRETLEAIARALLEHEVLDGEEIYDILGEHSDVDVEKIKRQKARNEGEVAESV
jgi:cell division protease FtsH